MVYVSFSEILGWGKIARLPLYFPLNDNSIFSFILLQALLGLIAFGILFYTDKKDI